MTLFVFQHTIKGYLEGQVKRPGIFEMKPGEFSDLLSFASGFNEFAYTASVNVLQKTAKEFKVQDIKASNSIVINRFLAMCLE
jgi:protein involved in polysaccharide export with SLBB domain